MEPSSSSNESGNEKSGENANGSEGGDGVMFGAPIDDDFTQSSDTEKSSENPPVKTILEPGMQAESASKPV